MTELVEELDPIASGEPCTPPGPGFAQASSPSTDRLEGNRWCLGVVTERSQDVNDDGRILVVGVDVLYNVLALSLHPLACAGHVEHHNLPLEVILFLRELRPDRQYLRIDQRVTLNLHRGCERR